MTTFQERLRLGSSIDRDRGNITGFSKLADEAADRIDELESLLTASIARELGLTAQVAEQIVALNDDAKTMLAMTEQLGLAEKQVAELSLIDNLCKEYGLSALGDLEALVKDAARYQWMRDVGDSTWLALARRPQVENPKQIDDAIDQCIAAQEGV